MCIPQKENRPSNIQNDGVVRNSGMAKSINKEEREEQLKNLLIDYQDLNKKNKQKPESHKPKLNTSEDEDFEEEEGNRVYAR